MKVVSKNFDTVWYHGYEFPVRYCNSPSPDRNDSIMVGTEEFENNYLISKYGDYADKEAELVDQGIYCYVPEEVLKTYSDEEFQKYVNENFD